MIAFIQGELCEVGQDTIIVACQGIGYEIQVPVSVAQSLPDPGNRVKIYTYTYVREDALGLFGFLTRDDLTVFKLLITVNGVGPKAALAILSSMTADELRFAILAEDAKAISKAPGIGPKTAKRRIIESVSYTHLDVYKRQAIGTFGGTLKDVPAAELGAIVVKEAVKRAGIKPETVSYTHLDSRWAVFRYL